jgi:eukaryotic-like serine/threonine-protein kinase
VRWLSDAAVDHLRAVADRPDIGGTPYELAEAIARGGMGTVYRARDRRLDRDVALKVMNAPAPAPGEIERMRDEARILARLEHPGIVPVHDLGTLPDGRLFYVMKLVRGRRLDEAMANAALHARLRTFERICDAVAFAHAQGVVHRDLKPENVMVGPFGEVLVLDWGVAKRLDVPGGPERDGVVLGTPGYMPPEQARGEMDRIDERADIYALGAMLDFLVFEPGGASGAPPGPPARSAGVNPAPLAALFGGPPATRVLDAICARTRAPHPEERYRSVRDLAAEVERFLSALPVHAYPEGPVERARRLAAKYRTPLLLVAAYLLMRIVLALVARV